MEKKKQVYWTYTNQMVQRYGTGFDFEVSTEILKKNEMQQLFNFQV